MNIVLRYAARSDVGLMRTSNQDSGYAGSHLLVVADGMGGPAGGDIASSVVLAHLVHLDDDVPAADDLLPALRHALDNAQAELEARAESDPELAGLGTTCVAILRTGNKLAMVHIGDSRAYLLREDRFTQVTVDHTFVQYLVDTGKISADQAEHHPQRSVLLRVLGDTESDVILDESVREAQVGDRWLLCSDGLAGVVSDDTIAEVLREVADPGECADRLIDLALRGGGPDNITCVVADVLDGDELPDGAAPSTAPQVVGAAATSRLQHTRGTPGAAGRAAALAAASRGDHDTSATDIHAEDLDTLGDRGQRRRRRWRGWGLLGLLVALVVGGSLLGYRWTQQQYYLAPADGMVGIYRGIPQVVGPVEFSRLHDTTDIAMSDLPTYARLRVEETITVSSLDQAEARVADLRADLRPDPQPQPPEPQTDPEPSTPPSPGATS